ncbi:helix-turn-helix transcriptional regulator [Laspinema sp. D1]|uniref:Helix-turn-helix transcriptional regulator n=1 Tax=Laspinema palackyanum D2a TaxID=2953684 RepID=A0ABT2MK99_9CYAN|nr:helix-turn-helix transcriptional regulator [Laspinema sp. D2a]
MTDYSTPPELNPVDLWHQTDKTQEELAEIFDVHPTTFARWCNGSRKPSLAYRRRAAELAQQLLSRQ